MKKAIVTGASGFVGGAVVKALSEADIEVIAIVRNQSSDISKIVNLKNVSIKVCEIKNYFDLPNILCGTEDIDAFFCFAWEGSSGPQRGNEQTQLMNVLGVCDAVRVCKKIGCKRFIFASSIMEREIIESINKDNSSEISSVYSVGKISADYMARAIANSLNIEYVSGMISNIYGAEENSPRLINTSIRKLLRNEKPSYSPGEQMYDFIYISDAAEAFVAIGEKGKNNKTYYIGSQKPKQLKEYLITLRNIVNPAMEIGLGDYKFNGVSIDYSKIDIMKLCADTGFTPKISFEKGIVLTKEWIEKCERDKR